MPAKSVENRKFEISNLKLELNYSTFSRTFVRQKINQQQVNYLPLLVFLLAEVLSFDAELFDFEAEPLDFAWSALALISLPTPATFAPASTAPLNAPVAAPTAAPLITSVKASVAFATMPFDELFFFEEEPLEAPPPPPPPLDFADDLLDDAFELEPEDLPAVFEPPPPPDDLLDAAFEPEPDDLPAEPLDAPPPPPLDLLAVDFPDEDDLLAVDLLAGADFAAVFEPEDLLADAADFAAVFAAGFAEADLLVAEADLLDDEDDLPLPDLLLDAADFPEVLFLFVAAIAFSLKGFFYNLRKNFYANYLRVSRKNLFYTAFL